MIKRVQEIKEKGFNMLNGGMYSYDDSSVEEENPFDEQPQEPIDFAKMRVGLRTMNDVLIGLGTYKKINRNYGDKTFVMKAMYNRDYKSLREISNYFYESSGIYYRLCRYLAFLYRYDWYVTPYIDDIEGEKEDKVLRDFSKVLLYLDKSNIKSICDNIALSIVRDGAYYGILVDFGDKFALQDLPASYCRQRYYSGPDPIVELNLQFFDVYFTNPQYRSMILRTFPQEIQQAYKFYKQGKLPGDYPGDQSCWVPLDPGTSVKISLNGQEFPPLAGVIPSLIDLDEAQDLDRQKTMQQLLKIIVQKLPLDKNGDLIFDVDEAKDIHNNAVAMLRRAIGVDVLTTFADIEKIDTKDANSNTTSDDLEKVERTVYNNAGVTKNIFNADGNLATTNSILVDETSMRDLLQQFARMINRMLEKFNRKNHYEFRVNLLETTQFNYKELAKFFKEQVTLGYSKMLPQIALGQSQSSVLATLMFENNILHLADVMIPPMSSNTMSSKNLGNNNQSNQNKTQNNQTGNAGRPEKSDDEKSDKTIQNRESMS